MASTAMTNELVVLYCARPIISPVAMSDGSRWLDESTNDLRGTTVELTFDEIDDSSLYARLLPIHNHGELTENSTLIEPKEASCLDGLTASGLCSGYRRLPTRSRAEGVFDATH